MSEKQETLQSWVEGIELTDEDLEIYLDAYGSDELEDSYLWSKFLKTMIKSYIPDSIEAEVFRKIDFSDCYGTLFIGARGTGKYTTAISVVKELCQKYGYSSVMVLTPMELDDAPDAETVRDRIDAMMIGFMEEACGKEEYFTDTEVKRSCIILDELSYSQYHQMALERIAAVLKWFYQNDAVPPFIICIEESEKRIPNALCRLLFTCRFALPDLEERKAYLKKYMIAVGSDSFLEEEERDYIRVNDIRLEDIAEMTEHFSYQQLADFVDFCKLSIMESIIRRELLYSVSSFRLGDSALNKKDIERMIEIFHVQQESSVSEQPVAVKVEVPAFVQADTGERIKTKAKQKKEERDYNVYDPKRKALVTKGIAELN